MSHRPTPRLTQSPQGEFLVCAICERLQYDRREQRWRGWEHTETTVRRVARRLRAQGFRFPERLHSKRRDAQEHCGLGARRVGGAWRTVCGKLRSGGGGAARSAYRGWWRGCEGAIRAAPMAESGVCRALFATSALRGGHAASRAPSNWAGSPKYAERRCPRRPNGLSLSCTARAHVPKPTRHGGCRGARAKTQSAICNRRDAVILVS
jgi:hypothetical protein